MKLLGKLMSSFSCQCFRNCQEILEAFICRGSGPSCRLHHIAAEPQRLWYVPDFYLKQP